MRLIDADNERYKIRIHFSYCYVNRDGYWSEALIGYKVIPWMPLPEPYKEEGESE